MNPKFLSSMLIMTGWILGSLLPGCSSVELTKVPKKPLPSQTPQLTELPLELSSKKGPRRPFDATTPSTLSGPGPEIIIVEIDHSALRTTAEQDAAVKQQLGDRFAFIGTEEVPADQCLVTVPSDDPPAPRATVRAISPETPLYRLTYYSYTHNVAVHVCLKDRQVFSVQADPREGYQPEEGEEEITAAINLARTDKRIAGDVQNLHGHAILTSPEEYRYFWVNDEAGFGDRVFWVTFSEMPESLALYFARVDLTTQTVLDAGKEAGPQ